MEGPLEIKGDPWRERIVRRAGLCCTHTLCVGEEHRPGGGKGDLGTWCPGQEKRQTVPVERGVLDTSGGGDLQGKVTPGEFL